MFAIYYVIESIAISKAYEHRVNKLSKLTIKLEFLTTKIVERFHKMNRSGHYRSARNQLVKIYGIQDQLKENKRVMLSACCPSSVGIRVCIEDTKDLIRAHKR